MCMRMQRCQRAVKWVQVGEVADPTAPQESNGPSEMEEEDRRGGGRRDGWLIGMEDVEEEEALASSSAAASCQRGMEGSFI